MLIEDFKNIYIKDLLDDDKISVRASNCCYSAKLESLFDILEYYKKHRTFKDLRNSGSRTSYEIINLIKEFVPSNILIEIIENEKDNELNNLEHNEYESYIKNVLVDSIISNQIDQKGVFTYLNDSQKEILKIKFQNYIKDYSIRLQNRLKSVGFDNFMTYYFDSNINNLIKIKGLGEKCLFEAQEIINKLKEDILTFTSPKIDNFDIKFEKYNGIIFLNGFETIFYKENRYLPMFWIFEQVLKNDESIDIKILIESFSIFQNQQLYSINELSTRYNLSLDNIRRKRKNLFHKIFEISNKFINKQCKSNKYNIILQNSVNWSYVLELFNNVNILHQESIEIQNYLKKEQCNFTIEFALHLIAFIFQERFTIFGDIDNSNKKKIWKNTFLIKSEYTEVFDFESWKDQFSSILMDNKTECLLNIEEHIANSLCWINYDYNKTEGVIDIIKEILLNEFYLYSDNINGKIKLSPNKEAKPIDIVYEILKQAGRPMDLEEIFEKFKLVIPEHKYTDAAQIRQFLYRHKDISFRNRKSEYTLKEWNHIKSGTIRNAIVEYLSEKDLPQTLDNITEYVLEFFHETNVSSIRTSMLIDSQRRFTFFKDNYFGLSSKQYPKEYVNTENVNTNRKPVSQRLYDFEKFIIENEHFPFSSSENKNEESLYRWWRLIIKGLTNISKEQKDIVERIQSQYSEYDIDKNTYEWNLYFNELKCFLLENRRKPSARNDEKILYDWLRRVKTDFENYNLNEEQRQKYISLAKLI